MGMINNPNAYGSPYPQGSGQQMGAGGLGLQMQTKTVLPNSLSPFAMEKKAVPGGGMPNMVSMDCFKVVFKLMTAPMDVFNFSHLQYIQGFVHTSTA